MQVRHNDVTLASSVFFSPTATLDLQIIIDFIKDAHFYHQL